LGRLSRNGVGRGNRGGHEESVPDGPWIHLQQGGFRKGYGLEDTLIGSSRVKGGKSSVARCYRRRDTGGSKMLSPGGKTRVPERRGRLVL